MALCLHGPIARKLEVNAGTNCLGPGNRANASIGRALQLVIRKPELMESVIKSVEKGWNYMKKLFSNFEN